MPHPLDNPVLSSLTGPHARFAEQRCRILRYPVDVCPFLALPDEPDEADWADAAELAMPGGLLPLARGRVSAPPGWKVTVIGEGVQMTGDDLAAAADPQAVVLGPSHVPEMLDLAGRTKPGPFLKRTIELGIYLGLRHEGKLVAMAGERLHPAGWSEISAVCTDQAWRGRGLATRLVRALGARIRARGEIPFLHALAVNTTAIRLYEDLGFRHRRTIQFAVARVPQARLTFGDSRRRRQRRVRYGQPAQFRDDQMTRVMQDLLVFASVELVGQFQAQLAHLGQDWIRGQLVQYLLAPASRFRATPADGTQHRDDPAGRDGRP